MVPISLSPIVFWGGSPYSAPVAKALTAAYVASDVQYPTSGIAPWNVVTLFPVLTGTVVTSIELLVELSIDGTNFNPIPNKAIGASIVGTVGEISLVLDASGRCPYIDIGVGAATHMRVSAKRTGGAADSALLLSGVGGSLR